MTNDPVDLYKFAEQRDIGVDWFPMQRSASLSVPLDDGSYSIAVDPWKMSTIQQEKVCLAHELGHCETGSFYCEEAALDVRQKHEHQADKWAINRLVPVDELDDAIADGRTDIWSLAEHFGVTEDFMRKAVCWYTHGNLAADLFF
ncbi:ImmA/IrrE family metallo-endopeptidase [Oscillibacter valericigenes]|uniref:ImmA/IrrE family metallo-endopeptidase n=1 Tax=Oscillibacter ruminantium TaxID=1263547 RepID=UPI000317DBB0|nr:ImmA/IrrE family metallo-endopeptidase [Oscillibacter ruminantium]MDN0031642.1 ImmA/IrrE family metallo-endopeptidase [Oscillibacter valericigenes]